MVKVLKAPRKKAAKGNGGDNAGQAAADDTKKQLDFLREVKELAQKHGIPMGTHAGAAQIPQRDLRIQVREKAGQVIVDFGQTPDGKPNSISWMALSVEQGTKFAATIIKIVQNIQSIGAVGGAADPKATDEGEEKKPDPEKVDKDK
jgi:hypothetical protein